MKKKTTIIVAILLFVVLFIGTRPFPHNVKIDEAAIEYSLKQEDVAIPHEVFIEGTYYTRLFGKDRFSGIFYVSDIKKADAEMSMDFRFHLHERHSPVFRLPSGELITTEIGEIFFDRNFETLAMQLACKYIEHENGVSVAWNDSESNFIVIGATGRDDALNTYRELLANRK